MWLIILMHIIYISSRIVGHGILTYVIGADLIGHLKLVRHLANGSLLIGRYKHFHDFLVRNILDVHSYYVVIYFDDIYYELMMFGIMDTRKWDPGILFPNGMGWRALLIVGVQYKQWDHGIFFVTLISNFWETSSRGDELPT